MSLLWIFLHSSEGSYQTHFHSHWQKAIYICDQCEYSGTQACSLKAHLLRHNDEKPHSCEECGQSFKEKRVLKQHMVSAHKEEVPFKCRQCEYVCTRNDNLKRHERTHSETPDSKMAQIYLKYGRFENVAIGKLFSCVE